MYFISQGIRYGVANNKNELTVLGFGINQDSYEVIVPSELNGCKVTEIASNAFSENLHIHKIILPETITKIGEKAFYKCANLKTIKINDSPNNMANIYIYQKAFANCVQLEEFSCFRPIYLCGESAFCNCKCLITIVSCFMDILPQKTFDNCENLSRFYFCDKDLTITDTAFNGCLNLSEIFISEDFDENDVFLYQIKNCKIRCDKNSRYASLAYHGYNIEIIEDD